MTKLGNLCYNKIGKEYLSHSRPGNEYGPLRHFCGVRMKSVGDHGYVLDLVAAIYYIIITIKIIVVVSRPRVCMGGFCYIDYQGG